MVVQKKKKDEDEAIAPIAVVDEDEVKKLQGQKKRIQELMDFIKEEWLDTDKEFMKEVYEAIEEGL